MSVSEAQRRQVYADLERAVGPVSAAILMEQVFAIDWRDLARQSAVDAQFVALRGEMAESRDEVHGQARRLAAINALSVVAASMATAGLVLAAARLA